MKNVFSEYEEILNKVIGYSDYELKNKQEDSKDELVYCRTRECGLGNLICDAIESAWEGDFAIINGGSVRNNLKKENITKGGVIELLSWFNNIVIKELPGQV